MLFKCTASPTNVWHWSRSWSLLSQDFGVLPCFVTRLNCLCHKQENATHWNRIPSIFICQDESHCQISLFTRWYSRYGFKPANHKFKHAKHQNIQTSSFWKTKKKRPSTCHGTMSSADSRAGILGGCDGAGPPGRCRVESAADLEVTSTGGQPTRWKNHGNWWQIDDFDDP